MNVARLRHRALRASLALACSVGAISTARGADDGIRGPFIPAGLPPMMQAAAAADPLAKRVYLFGPVTGTSATNNNETYVLDMAAAPARFERLSTVGPKPAARAGASLVFDPLRHRLLLIGGRPFQSSSTETDVWELTLDDPPRWSQLEPLGEIPGPRLFAIAIYDNRRDRILVYGGARKDGLLDFSLDDTWALELSPELTWSRLTPAGAEPPALALASAAYDPGRDRLLVFGGGDGSTGENPRYDLWSLSLAATPTWSLEAVDGTPPSTNDDGRFGAAFDSTADRLYIVSSEAPGRTEVTEIAFGDGEHWNPVATTGADPGEGKDAAIALVDRDLVSIGGSMVSDAHALDVDTRVWTDLEPIGASPPAGLWEPHVAIDSLGARVFALGGLPTTLWTLRLDSAAVWQRPFIPGVKPTATDMPVAWDPVGQRLLAVDLSASPTIQVWEMHPASPPTWNLLQPANDGPPTPTVALASIAFDARRNRLLLLDGYVDVPGRDPLWQLRLDPTPAWDTLPALPVPARGRVLGLGLDPSGDTLVLHFGIENAYGQTRTWDRPLDADDQPWTLLSVAGDPPLDAGDLVSDISHGRMLYAASGRVWSLETGPSPAWRELHPAGDVVHGSASGPAVFDGAGDRLLYPVTLYDNEPEGAELRFGTPSAPELICPPAASWSPGSIRDISFGLVNRSGGELSFEYTLACARAWPGFPIRGLAPSSGYRTDYVPIGIPVPDTAAFGSVRFDLSVTAREQAGLDASCSFSLLGEAAPVVALGADAQPDRVVVRWQTTQPGLTVAVSRRSEDGPWALLTRKSVATPGVVTYEDHALETDQRYYYRAELSDPARAGAYGQIRVDVPQWALGFTADQPNPVRGHFSVQCSVPSSGRTDLDVFDVNGRRAYNASQGAGGPGRITFDVDGTTRLSPGVYFLRLTQAGQTRKHTLVFLR